MTAFSIESTIKEFETLTKNASRVQRETLRKILEQNGETEYLQQFGLAGRTDPETFKACVPLVTHQDLEPYIQRIFDGDTSPILTRKPLTALTLSSGTTQGKRKFFPFNEELLQTTVQIYRISFAFRNREYPIGNGKALQFIYSSMEMKTNGGLTAASGTTNIYRSEQFKHILKDIQFHRCSPDEVIFCPHSDQSLYCHLLCGLIYSDEVQCIFAQFAHSLVSAFGTFELVWEELCNDIRHGVLSSRITVPSVRAAISKLLFPNPTLADSIYKKCKGSSNWYGVIPELFPNAKYVYGIMTGAMEPYLKKLRHYAGSLPLICADYGASEGWVGANVNPRLPPELATFAVIPNIAFFEFIPLGKPEGLENGASVDYVESEPVGLTEVEVGKEYEVVVTSFAGLCRYRLGDIVKVAGFHNSTPELSYVCRRNAVLSINIDKNTEKDVMVAAEEATKLLATEKLELVDFTSHVDRSTDPGHYVIFWELSSDASEEVLRSCCNCLDLAFVDGGYVTSRRAGGIGPLELRIVRKGTFRKILEHSISLGTAMNQFKTPRFVGPSHVKVLQILCDNVIKSYFSTAYGR